MFMIISLIRAILLYIIIILAIRLMGKRQISDLQTSELVVTLLISDIAAIPMQNSGVPLLSGLIPMAILVVCEIILSAVMMKSSKFRKFVCGKPSIVINDGKIDQSQMKELRMSTEDLNEQLRQLDVFNISDVAFAIIETNGKMSVLKKPEKQQPDNNLLGIAVPDSGIQTIVISDGEYSDFSLSLCGLSRDWVDGILLAKKLDIKDIFIMTANKNKEFEIIKKET